MNVEIGEYDEEAATVPGCFVLLLCQAQFCEAHLLNSQAPAHVSGGVIEAAFPYQALGRGEVSKDTPYFEFGGVMCESQAGAVVLVAMRLKPRKIQSSYAW